MPLDDAQHDARPPSEEPERPAAQTPVSISISTRAMAITLFVGVLLVYLPSLRNEFVYDDYSMILHQTTPSSLSEVGSVVKEMASGLPYYRPVTWSTFLIQKWLHGNSAAAFHFVNAVLMAATACMAFAFLLTPAFRINRGCACWAATLFAVHPASSACVYPIASGREALLAAFLMLASMCAFLRAGISSYITALLTLLAALLAREQAIVLPAIFVIADVLKLSPDAPGQNIRRWVSRYVPVLIVVAGWFMARWILFSGSEFQLAVINSPTTPIYSLAFAIQSIFVPFAALHYEPAMIDWFSWPRLLLASAGVLILISSVVRTRLGTGLENSIRRVASFWLAWFLLMFLPTSNILKQETEFDERYVFLSLLSVTAIVATLVSQFDSEISQVGAGRRSIHRGGISLGVLCVCLTIYRAGFYENNLTFYRSWTHSSPASALARHNLANSLLARGRNDEAIKSFQQAVILDPDFTASHFDLAQTAAKSGMPALAEKHYRKVIDLEPTHGKAHLYLGNILFQQKRFDESIEHLRKSVRLLPGSAIAHNSLGVALRRQDEFAEAETHLKTAISLAPGLADAWYNLAEVLSDMGNLVEAREALQRAHRLVPPNSWKAQHIQQRLDEHDSRKARH